MDVAAPVTPEPDAEVCLPDQRGDTVIAVGSDRMGDGEEALGKTLLKGFLYAVSQLPSLPQTILFTIPVRASPVPAPTPWRI